MRKTLKAKFTLQEEYAAAAWFHSPEYEATKFNEIFTHVDHLRREIRHFDATVINRDILRGKIKYHVAQIEITEDDYNRIVHDNGIEEPRVERLTYGVCRRPILLAEFDTNEHVIIDGNHRIVRRCREGLPFVVAFFIPESEWKRYLVTMPKLVEYLKVEDTINAQVISHKERYGIKAPTFKSYRTITG